MKYRIKEITIGKHYKFYSVQRKKHWWNFWQELTSTESKGFAKFLVSTITKWNSIFYEHESKLAS